MPTFIDDPLGVKHRHRVGVENMMWSSDYPHTVSTWPHSQGIIARRTLLLTPSSRPEWTEKCGRENAMSRPLSRWFAGLLAAMVLAETGCATKMLDGHVTPPPQARHCEGSEFVTSTDMAVLPIPGLAFFVPKITFNAPDSSELLAKCGGKQQMNRTVRATYRGGAPTIFLPTPFTHGA